MATLLTPTPRQYFTNPSTGLPYPNARVFTYAAGTTTKQNTFTDSTGAVPNTNPVVTDSLGECDIWLSANLGYKFVFAPPGTDDPPTSPIWTRDNIFGSPTTTQISPWAVAGGSSDAITATYAPPNTSLPDGLLLAFRASAANATTTPTFSPDGQAAFVIVQAGGLPLSIGAIPGQNYEVLVRFNLANSYWELLNAFATNTSTPQKSIASAATTNIGSINSTNLLITGTTTITGLGSSAVTTNPLYTVQFSGSLTLTYNATSLILPGAQNIITQANDVAHFEYLGSGNWQCTEYIRANGQILSMAGATVSIASATTTDLGTTASNSVLITGTTTITGLGSSASLANPIYFIRFNGALTLTYNASSLIIPGAKNITTAAGDTCQAEYLGSGNWRIRDFSPAGGLGTASVAYSGFASFTIGTTYSFAHGLGVVPDFCVAQVKNITPELSFSAGDIVGLYAGPIPTQGFGPDLWWNSTTAGVDTNTGITVLSKGTSSANNITAANWQMQIIAVKFNL